MNVFRFLIIACLLLAGCSTEEKASGQPATPSLRAPTPAPVKKDTITVEAWVDKPEPKRDERVTVHGSLIKNGVRLGGMAMEAIWPDEDQERGKPNCRVQVIYGSGVCMIEASEYPAGEFVPITVVFRYEGEIYTAQTGFTPQ